MCSPTLSNVDQTLCHLILYMAVHSHMFNVLTQYYAVTVLQPTVFHWVHKVAKPYMQCRTVCMLHSNCEIESVVAVVVEEGSFEYLCNALWCIVHVLLSNLSVIGLCLRLSSLCAWGKVALILLLSTSGLVFFSFSSSFHTLAKTALMLKSDCLKIWHSWEGT